jgi:DtxR family transcriptional regulator, iron-dependent repressor
VHDGFHPPLEEYLEAVYELQEEGTPVIQARLAERLGHAPPSVSEMIGRLRADGFLEIDGRAIRLTRKGRGRAESVVRKHRLAERLLTDVIGLEWHKTHIEACRWEHVISDDVEAKLVVLLGNPTTCPHGNPIPGTTAPDRHLTALAESQPGDHVRLERVTEQVEVDTASLTYLDSHGFIPGVDAEVQARADDGTLTLEVDAGTLSIERELAEQLYVAVS